MLLTNELQEIFKHKQKSYKMALILSLTKEGLVSLHEGVPLDRLAKSFRSYYLERQQSGLPCDVPPSYLGSEWAELTDAQVRTVMDNPMQALQNILSRNPNGTVSFNPHILDNLDDAQLTELRDYALREETAYYSSLNSTEIQLRSLLLQVMNSYRQARKESIKGHPIDELVRKTIPHELRKLPFVQKPLIVDGSVGKGNWATIPWIAVMNEQITTSTQYGEYLVYLFAEDMSSVYLSFAQGVTEPKKQGKKAAYQYLNNKAAEIRELIPLNGAQKDREIYLAGSGLGGDYQESTVAYYKYTREAMPSDEQLLADLKSMIENYNLYSEKRQVAVAMEQEVRPVFRFTMAYLHYSHGLASYLAENNDFANMVDLLHPSNKPKLFKSGDAIKHPEDRLRNFIRVLKEMRIIEENNKHYTLTEFGKQYTSHLHSYDPWVVTVEQAQLLRGLIDDPGTSNELPKVIYHAAQIAKQKQSFTLEGFQPDFIEFMGKTELEEVTKQSRTQYMLNWLEELRYIRRNTEDGSYHYEEEVDEMNASLIDNLTVHERIGQIKTYIVDQGFSYPDALIENFYLSMKTKPFVILAGISGTGKTKLVKLFAEAMGATVENKQFKLIPVRPDWSDSSDLIGYQDLSGQFRPGPLTEVLLEAQKPANLDKPYFVCLDEMNLARVEHYFSDMLSILETQRREGSRIVTDDIVRKELLLSTSTLQPIDDLIFPDNVFLIGTVNMDETTHPFSKKVLDRANTLEFNYIRLDDYPRHNSQAQQRIQASVPVSFLKADYLSLQDAFGEYETLIRRTTEQLVRVNNILEELHAHIGFRVRDAVCFYMIYNSRFELLDEDAAFDMQLLQKILPRLQGSSPAVKRVIITLLQYCIGKSKGSMDELLHDASELYKPWRSYSETPEAKYPHSARKLAYMLWRLEEDGFTSFWLS